MKVTDCPNCGTECHIEDDYCGGCGLSTGEVFGPAEPASKRCSRCQAEKTLGHFSRDQRWLRSECKACEAVYRKAAATDETRAKSALRSRAYRARIRVLLARARWMLAAPPPPPPVPR